MATTPVGIRSVPLTRTFAVITVAGGVLAFALAPQSPIGQQIWPAMLEFNPAPAGAQVGLFMVLGAIESLAFGAGAAVLLLGREPIRQLFGPQRRRLASASHVAVFWLLWSWWLHVGMHMTSGMRAGRVLVIEYGFHVTSILAGGVLAYALFVLGSGTARTAQR